MKVQKKTTIAMIAVAATVTVAGVGTAEATSKKSVVKATSFATTSSTARPSIGGMGKMGVDPIASVLAGLVSKGTITQAQSDAITAALAAARPAVGLGHMDGGPAGFDKQGVILSTLGIDATTLRTGLQAGKSLAAIAGAKTQALIDALVAAETKAIDAAVSAGKMTTAQATTAKAGLVAHVTAEVNQVGGIGMGGMGRGHGMGDMDGDHLPGTTPGNK